MFLDYELPADRIAQRPVEPRDAARLLVARRADGSLEHRTVADLPELLAPGDLVVVNDTRVLPARLLGRRETTGGKWEGLYLQSGPGDTWAMMSKSGGTLRVGERVIVDGEDLSLELVARPDGEPWLFRPSLPGPPEDLLTRFGMIPLPPYIRQGRGDEADREQYQTVFAEVAGSVAAPTAGLHFTPELLARLTDRGINRATVTLHVGLGTFQPLTDGDPDRHAIHREWCAVPGATAEAIRKTKEAGGRVVAIGTTSVRTLESSGGNEWSGDTALFIRPGYEFRVVDALMTNFHLPRTSLLLLVGALTGDDLIRAAYAEAVVTGYRFYSYGDAMLVL
ncbi:MAG: tRNA preQ1(34) S-adenosylmethionine ribosyltransferase-isomerase QueA [Gemmataceae bacterium]|nr:tRNA preQ1(34) S-adenosylmethionine ribosyltransferase-isomerase QueA [Gemmataceae bacterium]